MEWCVDAKYHYFTISGLRFRGLPGGGVLP